MNWLLTACGAIIILYILRVFFWIRDWSAVETPFMASHATKTPLMASLPISIIVAARNEANNIANLLNNLQAQDYPKDLTEIIIVDDHSTDETAAIIGGFSTIKLVSLSIGEGKKAAIELGVKSASGQLILCTDADCLPPPTWVSGIVSFYELTNAAFISAPVSLVKSGGSFAGSFDEMESAVLIAIGGASIAAGRPTMCNGANLAYPKKVFEEVGGYAGNAHIPSGDDEFLMHKVAEMYPGKVYFLKDRKAIVTTTACPNWKSLFAQRTRWASKHRHYRSIKVKLELLLVLLANLSFLYLLIGSIAGWFDYKLPLAFIIAKVCIDLNLLSSSFHFLNKKVSLARFLFFQLTYPFYLICIGLAANFFRYSWKGRKVN